VVAGLGDVGDEPTRVVDGVTVAHGQLNLGQYERGRTGSPQAVSAVLRVELAELDSVLVQGVVKGQPAVRKSEAKSDGTVGQVAASPLEKLHRRKLLPAPGSQHAGNIVAPDQPEAV
jgi:hypothetical protein